MAALHYCMVEWPGHHKLASAGSEVGILVLTDNYIIIYVHAVLLQILGNYNLIDSYVINYKTTIYSIAS